METSLFIGRFQPFHLGHLSVIQKIIKSGEKLIIGIGSSEQNYLPENPFTASERFQMIDETLKDLNIATEKYCIIPIRNINNYALWPDHVERIIPPFGTVYTGSPIVKNLFEQQGKHEIKNIEKNLNICGTEVRKKMLTDDNWEEMVPKKVEKLIKKWNGVKRLQEIC